MKEQIKKFINWVLDVDGSRSDTVLRRSITGEPTLCMSCYGSIWTTDIGLQGSFLSVMLSQFGSDVPSIKKILKNEYDYCLSHEDKVKLINIIRERTSKGGEWLDTKRKKDGSLYFVKSYWKEEDLEEIRSLLQQHEE